MFKLSPSTGHEGGALEQWTKWPQCANCQYIAPLSGPLQPEHLLSDGESWDGKQFAIARKLNSFQNRETLSCARCIVYCVPRVLTLWTQYVWTGHRHVLVKQAGYIGSSLFSMKTAQNWTKKTDLRMLDTLILPVSAAAPILSCCHTLYTRDH